MYNFSQHNISSQKQNISKYIYVSPDKKNLNINNINSFNNSGDKSFGNLNTNTDSIKQPIGTAGIDYERNIATNYELFGDQMVQIYFCSVTSWPQFINKSVEELRYEDFLARKYRMYQDNNNLNKSKIYL